MSWWDDRWWCACGAEYLVTDVDAMNHYHSSQLQIDGLRVWTHTVEED